MHSILHYVGGHMISGFPTICFALTAMLKTSWLSSLTLPFLLTTRKWSLCCYFGTTQMSDTSIHFYLLDLIPLDNSCLNQQFNSSLQSNNSLIQSLLLHILAGNLFKMQVFRYNWGYLVTLRCIFYWKAQSFP